MIPVNPVTFARRFRTLAASLTPEEAAVLLGALDVHEAASGEALVGEGSRDDVLYLVWEGELEVSMGTPEGDRKVGQIGPGEFVGEVSLLDPGPALTSVLAPQGCVTLRLSRERFDELCASTPALARKLVRDLSRALSARIRATAAQLDELLAAQKQGSAAGAKSTEALVAVHATLFEHRS